MANAFPKNGLSLSETISKIEEITGELEEGKSFIQSIGEDGTVKADHYYHGERGVQVRFFTINQEVAYYSISDAEGKFDYVSI